MTLSTAKDFAFFAFSHDFRAGLSAKNRLLRLYYFFDCNKELTVCTVGLTATILPEGLRR